MNTNYKIIIVKIEEYIGRLFKSKAFIYAVIAIILGLLLVAFSVKTKNTVEENFYMNDAIELRDAKREVIGNNNITMQEINRVSKLLTFFFNDVIVSKRVIVNGISEDFNNIDDYDMQITNVVKAGETYEARIVIAKPMTNSEELMYEPYKRYEVIIKGTEKGLKVDYINILES